MIEVRKTILAVVAALTVAAGARAELIPVSAEATSTAPSHSHSLSEAESREILLFGLSDDGRAAIDLASQTAPLAAEARTAADETAVPPHAIALKDGRGSVDLCLYALIGFGVFRSGHWVRRSSLGFLPEWYHSGAPQQIGHSHAVGPDAYCHADLCFVQPDTSTAENLLPHIDETIFASLVRESQSTPQVVACRPPPSMS